MNWALYANCAMIAKISEGSLVVILAKVGSEQQSETRCRSIRNATK